MARALGTTTRSFEERLAAGQPLLLDGAMGTELDRRGVPVPAPLWSALALIERPDVVRAIHLDYARAGADILTTNTFRTTRRTLAGAGRDPDEAGLLTGRAVALAREARAGAGRPEILIAGSIAPLEDCYSPELSPPFETALREHRLQAASLAAAGVDLLLIETMPRVAEAEAAVRAARETGLPAAVSFVVGADGRLLSGEPLSAAVVRVKPHNPSAILINCAAPGVVGAALDELARLTDRPRGGYANVCMPDAVGGWVTDPAISGAAYAAAVASWLAQGALIVGGCCGSEPRHIAALRGLLDRPAAGTGPHQAGVMHRAPAGPSEGT